MAETPAKKEDIKAPQTFEYDPEKDGPTVVEAVDVDVTPNKATTAVGYEVFGGKVYSAEVVANEAVKETIRHAASQRDTYVNYKLSHTHIESPLERLQRLKNEVDQFQTDLSMMADTQPIQDVSLSNGVGAGLAQLEQGLGSVLGDHRVAPYLPSSVPLGAAGIAPSQRQLGAALVGAVGGSGPAKMTAELYAQPAKDETTILHLGRRIDMLEKSLGKSAGENAHVSLSALREQTSLLDEHTLDAIFRRVKTLVNDMDMSETQAKGSVAGGVAVDKMKELNKLMQQWNKLTDLVPQMVSRLTTQKEVHERHANVLIREQRLQRTQASLNSLVSEDNDALKAVSASFEENLKMLKANAAAFDKRLSALKA